MEAQAVDDVKAVYKSKTKRSMELFEEARKYIPSGSSHPAARFFKPYNVFVNWAKGTHIRDVDGNEYIDYWITHGAMFLGHSNAKLVAAIQERLTSVIHVGTYTELELALAKQALKMIKTADMIRFANTGTESTLSACRLARAYTGRKKIAKFGGHYHGWHDTVLVGTSSTGTGVDSAGIPEEVVANTMVMPWNDFEATKKLIEQHASEIAGVILEPSPSSGVPPADGFLKGLREVTTANDVPMIFDEVVTGFRYAPGGAQEYYGVKADLITYAKILGGGLPIGAVAGRRDIMELLNDPSKQRSGLSSFHGGTYSGNALSMAAGLTTLKELEGGELYRRANDYGKKLREGIGKMIDETRTKACASGECSATQVFFLEKVPTYFRELGAGTSAQAKQEAFKLELVNRGVYNRPSSRLYNTPVHSDDDLAKTLDAARVALKKVRDS